MDNTPRQPQDAQQHRRNEPPAKPGTHEYCGYGSCTKPAGHTDLPHRCRCGKPCDDTSPYAQTCYWHDNTDRREPTPEPTPDPLHRAMTLLTDSAQTFATLIQEGTDTGQPLQPGNTPIQLHDDNAAAFGKLVLGVTDETRTIPAATEADAMERYRTEPTFRAAVDELVQDTADTVCDQFGVDRINIADLPDDIRTAVEHSQAHPEELRPYVRRTPRRDRDVAAELIAIGNDIRAQAAQNVVIPRDEHQRLLADRDRRNAAIRDALTKLDKVRVDLRNNYRAQQADDIDRIYYALGTFLNPANPKLAAQQPQPEDYDNTPPNPQHPGEILADELAARGLTTKQLADHIGGFTPNYLDRIIEGRTAINPDLAVRLSRALGTSDRFWINLQNNYDLDYVRTAHKDHIDTITPL
jgi:addiction module HigA family antidote